MLSNDCERGNGVPMDHAQSLVWLRKAADQGDPMTMDVLGMPAFLGFRSLSDVSDRRFMFGSSEGLIEREVATMR